MKARHLLFAWMCVGALSCASQAKQLAVVADPANTTSNVSASELEKILSARMQTWPDGKPITVVLHDPSSADMQLVLRKLLNMTADQARTFFHAHSGAIVVADSDESVLRFVSSTRGAIGVIDLYSLTKDVKVLKVDGKLPVEQGYILRGN
jgi:ABC-type phosphate transport system substrate-binding protein